MKSSVGIGTIPHRTEQIKTNLILTKHQLFFIYGVGSSNGNIN